jgi:UDP:flavonoid glycosyltransferase YjiC (YdhE family)
MFDWCQSPARVIGLFPPWFAPPQPDWPPQTRLTGFPLFDPPGTASDAASVLARFDQPPLVATPGSAMVHGHAFFAAVIDASRRLDRPALLLTRFPEQVPRPLPPGVVHHAYLPLREVLPGAAALIHHGGIGTTAQALAAGVPQIVMPMSHDQPDNAARLRRLGVGTALPARWFTGRRLAVALGGLLTSPVVAARCRSVAAACDPVATLAATVRLIEAEAL